MKRPMNGHEGVPKRSSVDDNAVDSRKSLESYAGKGNRGGENNEEEDDVDDES